MKKITAGRWKMRNGTIAEITIVPENQGNLPRNHAELIYGTIHGVTENWYIDGKYFDDEDSDPRDLISAVALEINEQELPSLKIKAGDIAPLGENMTNDIPVVMQAACDRARRDSIALDALKAMLVHGCEGSPEDVAFTAYRLADAMIAEGKA